MILIFLSNYTAIDAVINKHKTLLLWIEHSFIHNADFHSAYNLARLLSFSLSGHSRKAVTCHLSTCPEAVAHKSNRPRTRAEVSKIVLQIYDELAGVDLMMTRPVRNSLDHGTTWSDQNEISSDIVWMDMAGAWRHRRYKSKLASLDLYQFITNYYPIHTSPYTLKQFQVTTRR